MRAGNLTISIPYAGCDKDCSYCVSKMTGYICSNFELMKKNVEKVKTLARASGVTNVLITGKGEPLINPQRVLYFMNEFREFPIEIQTNGLRIQNTSDYLMRSLARAGVNTIAISIDKYEDMSKFEKLIKEFGKDVIFRFTVNVTNLLGNHTAEEVFNECKRVGAHQFSIRSVTVANHAEKTPDSIAAQEWISKNVSEEMVKDYFNWYENLIKSRGKFLMTLPFGVKLFEVDGISITWFDYCVQDDNHYDDIRSLIFQEDGHLYVAWNSNYKIL